jgi:phosphatidylglycerophosphate synthase
VVHERGLMTSADVVSVKGRDCWWTVLVIDPIAGPLVRPLSRIRRVTPNGLTAASAIVAAGAAASFALGSLVLGALLFQLSFLLDCMDGKLAHTRGKPNRFGPYMDAVADAARFVLCTGALAYFVASDETPSPAWTAVLVLFPAVHYAVLLTQAAWPTPPTAEPVLVHPTPFAFLQIARRRLSRPGTTVDTEALALTIGPLIGIPLYGLLAALVVDAARLVLTAGVWTRRAVGAADAPPPQRR